jgi:hypothetical protein
MLCRCMTILAQEHEAPYEGKLSLNWNREVRRKMRVVLWAYPKGGITDNLPSGSGKSRQRRNSRALSRARRCEHEIE